MTILSKKGISRVSDFPNFLALASVGGSTFFRAGLFPEIKFEHHITIMDHEYIGKFRMNHLTKGRKRITVTVKHQDLDLRISDQDSRISKLSEFCKYNNEYNYKT